MSDARSTRWLLQIRMPSPCSEISTLLMDASPRDFEKGSSHSYIDVSTPTRNQFVQSEKSRNWRMNYNIESVATALFTASALRTLAHTKNAMMERPGKRNTTTTSSRRGSDSQMRLRHTKQTPLLPPLQLVPFFSLRSSKAGNQGTEGIREKKDESTMTAAAVLLIRRRLSDINLSRLTKVSVWGERQRWRLHRRTEWVDNATVGLELFFSVRRVR